MDSRAFQEAKALLDKADAAIILTGAGWSADSGLPVFRGNEGFWENYPPYKNLDLGFTDLASPKSFEDDPAIGLGFYLHRLGLYRDTNPHSGFKTLLGWLDELKHGYHIVTSNVDGSFQKAGFPDEKVFEVHGSIHHWQCLDKDCSSDQELMPAPENFEIDESTMRSKTSVNCPICGTTMRPAIYMFNDYEWDSRRTDNQERRYSAFINKLAERGVENVAVIEIGAGMAVSTIRLMSESAGNLMLTKVIRINPEVRKLSFIRNPHLVYLQEKGRNAIEKLLSAETEQQS